ncbi:ABC transporter permease [Candidatus Sumerlaeota bacterium]|nr:ABC transporter permease [Candidatus Sumerlaeota bacterium]
MNVVRFERAVRMGAKNLWQYKMRAGLTILGMVFGVSSVIAMLSVAEGAGREVQEQIRRLGSNNILISSQKLPQEQFSGGQSGGTSQIAAYGLTYEDANRLAVRVPYLVSSCPAKVIQQTVRFRDRQVETTLVATVPQYPEITNHRMLAGRFFTKTDMDKAAPVCVIGARLARTLFAAHDPIDQTIKLGNDEVYRVIGVMGDVYTAKSPELTNKPLWFVGENQDVYLPLISYFKRSGDLFMHRTEGSSTFEKVELHQLILTVDGEEHVMPAYAAARDTLRTYHKREDYQIVVPLELLEQSKATRRLFNIVLGAIAAISLIVGGIGIMNIMLATVSERTREIGIRRALGARQRDIVMQFLIETVILSITGGLIGLFGGALIPKIITLLTNVKTVLTPLSFVVAFGVSVAVGLVFGIYPARRAALMDPIEALRHE